MNPAPGVLHARDYFRQSMDIAIVTGAETPLGLRVIERLIDQGCRVHGIGNNFANVTFADPQFIAHAVDLTKIEAVRETTQKILDEEKRLHIVVHAIDVTPGTPFRKLPVGNLEAILKIGLLGPVMLTRLALPNLMRFRGQLINIIPSNKSGSPASAVNALIEGGLREMNHALFDQARDAGLRVTNLILRQNTELPSGTASDEQLIQSRIDPEDVANTVERLLDPHATNIPNEIVLHPRLSAEAPFELPETPEALDPYSQVILPPKEYFPPEREPIPTKQPDSIERTIPYTDEEMEDKIAAAIEDYESDPERFKAELRGNDQANEDGHGGNKKRRRRRGGRNRNKNRDEQTEGDQAQETTEQATETTAQEESSERSNDKPKRRRGGRNRNKNRDEHAEGEQTQETTEKASTETPDQGEPTEKSDDKPKRRRRGRNRNRDRKPRTEEGEAQGEHSSTTISSEPPRSNRRRTADKSGGDTPSASSATTESKPAEDSEPEPKPKATKTSKSSAPRKKAAKKKTAAKASTNSAEEKAGKKPKAEQLELVAEDKPVKKKVAKKAAKKATKKTATKKAAKKTSAKKKTATKKAAKKKAAKKTVEKKEKS